MFSKTLTNLNNGDIKIIYESMNTNPKSILVNLVNSNSKSNSNSNTNSASNYQYILKIILNYSLKSTTNSFISEKELYRNTYNKFVNNNITPHLFTLLDSETIDFNKIYSKSKLRNLIKTNYRTDKLDTNLPLRLDKLHILLLRAPGG